MSAPAVITAQMIQEGRARRYRQLPSLRARSEREALEFINDVGVCLLFSAKGTELPTLWGALCGEDRPLPHHHDDHSLGLAWDWKDSIPTRGEALYGKFVKQKPVFIALDLAPCFYALTENYGQIDDYLEEYLAGRLSEEAKRIYETILAEGPLATSELRRRAGISSKGAAGLFDRAVTELQMGFKIVKVGTSEANRWKYCYVYDLFLRRFPGVVQVAHSISQDEAAATLMTRYLKTVIAASAINIGRLFGWDGWRLERTVRLVTEKRQMVVSTQIAGWAGEFLLNRESAPIQALDADNLMYR
jgi:hypothetical protein